MPPSTLDRNLDTVRSEEGSGNLTSHCCDPAFHLPSSLTPFLPSSTSTFTTCPPEKLISVHPRVSPDKMVSRPVVLLLLEPSHEYVSGLSLGGVATVPFGEPQPSV